MELLVFFSSVVLFISPVFTDFKNRGDLASLSDIGIPEQQRLHFRTFVKRSAQAEGGNASIEKNYATGLDVRLQILKWTKHNDTPWASRFRWSIINQSDPNNMTTIIYRHKDNNYTAEEVAVFARAVDNIWYKIDFPSLSFRKYLALMPVYEGKDNLVLTPDDFKRVSAYVRDIKDIKDVMNEIDMQCRRKRSINDMLVHQEGESDLVSINSRNKNIDTKSITDDTDVVIRSSSTVNNLNNVFNSSNSRATTKLDMEKFHSCSRGLLCQVQEEPSANSKHHTLIGN